MDQSIDLNIELIERCKQGDIKAQFSLYKRYSGAMYNIAIRFLKKHNIEEYPKLDINEENFIHKTKIIESSAIEYDAVKGKEYEGMTEIKVEGYDISLTITDY